MKCPDCRGNIECELIDRYTANDDGYEVLIDEPYWKCPKCKQEYEDEDLT